MKTYVSLHTSNINTSHPFLFKCKEKVLFDERFKATTPSSSWAMTPYQKRSFSCYRIAFYWTRSLSAIFGELLKYNCVILYKAVLGWQHPQKLHYSAFYWGVKKGHSCWVMNNISLAWSQGKTLAACSGGVLHWIYMDHLKWNQFSWIITAGCHNGFYLMTINTCIDLKVGSNNVREGR